MPFTRELNEPGDLVRYKYFDGDGKQLDGLSCGVDHEKTPEFKQALVAWVVRWIKPGEKHPAALAAQDLVLKAMEDF